MSKFGMATAPQIRALIEQVWTGDDDARYILADAYDEIGRRDIAMLWRDELPGYRRRKRVDKLTREEVDQIEANLQWYRTEVQYRTGPSDEQLALAAIGCLYRASDRHRFGSAETVYPRVTWLPAPSVLRRNILAEGETGLGVSVWYYRRTVTNYRTMTQAVNRSIGRLRTAFLDAHLDHAVERAGFDEDLEMGTGLSGGQFSIWLLEHAAAIDVLRLWHRGHDDEQTTNNELSLRASFALARCTPMYYPFERACILSVHPTVIDGDQPRWAWLDSGNHPHQWPTTR